MSGHQFPPAGNEAPTCLLQVPTLELNHQAALQGYPGGSINILAPFKTNKAFLCSVLCQSYSRLCQSQFKTLLLHICNEGNLRFE